jgi:hypothetical protein
MSRVLLPGHVGEKYFKLASQRMCGSMLAAWQQLLPVAIEHGVHDMPHAMMLSVCT